MINLLLFVEPRIEKGLPYYREPWIDPFCIRIIKQLNNPETKGQFRFAITLNEALEKFREDPRLDGVRKIQFVQEELYPDFCGDWLEMSAAWYDNSYTQDQLAYYVKLIDKKLTDFCPDII
ncbi:hypothetical protein KAR91_79135, partial [Candidatus Pacearchaeota archaeon]|nr:hypothetical protein [Candidatus Pacearchaeota archaeon]